MKKVNCGLVWVLVILGLSGAAQASANGATAEGLNAALTDARAVVASAEELGQLGSAIRAAQPAVEDAFAGRRLTYCLSARYPLDKDGNVTVGVPFGIGQNAACRKGAQEFVDETREFNETKLIPYLDSYSNLLEQAQKVTTDLEALKNAPLTRYEATALDMIEYAVSAFARGSIGGACSSWSSYSYPNQGSAMNTEQSAKQICFTDLLQKGSKNAIQSPASPDDAIEAFENNFVVFNAVINTILNGNGMALGSLDQAVAVGKLALDKATEDLAKF